MRCLLACTLLLYCSISYGQTLTEVPSPILPVPVTSSDCACTDCECAVVSVEVERTGIFARLFNRRGDREGPRFLLKIFTRRNAPEPEVEGAIVVPPAPKGRI